MKLEVQEVLEDLYEDVIEPNWDRIKKIYVGDYDSTIGKYLPIDKDKEATLKDDFNQMEPYEWEVTEIETTANSIWLSIRDSELCIAMSIEYNVNQEAINFSCVGE